MFRKRPTSYGGMLQRYFGAVVFTAVFFGIVSFAVSAFQDQEYETTGRLLILPGGNLELDAFSASRAGERLGGILIEVIHSNTFLDAVLFSEVTLRDGTRSSVFDDYGENLKDRLKKWRERVELEVSPASGILSIKVYHKQPEEAQKTMRAIMDTVEKSGDKFFAGQGVTIQLVDNASTSNKPVRPHVFLNTIGGVAVGFIVALGILYLFVPTGRRQHA